MAASHSGSGAKQALQVRKWTQTIWTWEASGSLKGYRALVLACEHGTGLGWREAQHATEVLCVDEEVEL